jgi:hypothetical protein
MGGYDPESGRSATEKYRPPMDGNHMVIGKATILCIYLIYFPVYLSAGIAQSA